MPETMTEPRRFPSLARCLPCIALTLLACSRSTPPQPSPPASASPASTAQAPAALAPALPHRLESAAVEVHVEEGNLVVSDASGHRAQLTSKGLDEAPLLTKDGRVAFLRRMDQEDLNRHDLLIVRADGSEPELLVHDDPKRMLAEDVAAFRIHDVCVHPDGKRLLFSISTGRHAQIFTVDLATKAVKWLSSSFGYSYILVPRGPFVGDLVIVEHRLGGAPDACKVVDGTTGKEKMEVLFEPCLDTPRMQAELKY